MFNRVSLMRVVVGTLSALLATMAWGDTITMRDGTTHTGTLVSATSQAINFRENGDIRRYLVSEIQSIEFDSAGTSSSAQSGSTIYPQDSGTRQSAPVNNQGAPTSNESDPVLSQRGSAPPVYGAEATLPMGSVITIITNQDIDSKAASPGQVFPADVAENIVDESGQTVIPKGSEAELVIRELGNKGTVSGTSDLVLDLQSVRVAGRRYMVSTEDIEQRGREGLGKNKRTATMVGGGAVLGTVIGAIAGGGKGAAIGAAAGAAAGAGTQVLTRGKTVKVPAESRLQFKLDQPLHLEAAY
ncbi:MAG TPA: hypothetical protein VHR84_16105 [Terriglobales bacterium]|nr:hypothetical protein [Terriglobales bacterium]